MDDIFHGVQYISHLLENTLTRWQSPCNNTREVYIIHLDETPLFRLSLKIVSLFSEIYSFFSYSWFSLGEKLLWKTKRRHFIGMTSNQMWLHFHPMKCLLLVFQENSHQVEKKVEFGVWHLFFSARQFFCQSWMMDVDHWCVDGMGSCVVYIARLASGEGKTNSNVFHHVIKILHFSLLEMWPQRGISASPKWTTFSLKLSPDKVNIVGI